MVERVSQIPDKAPKDSLKGGEVSVDDEVYNIIKKLMAESGLDTIIPPVFDISIESLYA